MTRPQKLVWMSPWDAFERDLMRHGKAGNIQFVLSLSPLWGTSSKTWRAVLNFGEPSSVLQDVDSRADGLRGAFYSAVEDFVLPELEKRHTLAERCEEMKGLWCVQVWMPVGEGKWWTIPGAAGLKSYAQGYYDGLTSMLPRNRAYRLVNAKGEEVERRLTARAPSVPSTGDRARLDRAARKGFSCKDRLFQKTPHDSRTHAFIEFAAAEMEELGLGFGRTLHLDFGRDLAVGSTIMDCWFAEQDKTSDPSGNNPPDGS